MHRFFSKVIKSLGLTLIGYEIAENTLDRQIVLHSQNPAIPINPITPPTNENGFNDDLLFVILIILVIILLIFLSRFIRFRTRKPQTIQLQPLRADP